MSTELQVVLLSLIACAAVAAWAIGGIGRTRAAAIGLGIVGVAAWLLTYVGIRSLLEERYLPALAQRWGGDWKVLILFEFLAAAIIVLIGIVLRARMNDKERD